MSIGKYEILNINSINAIFKWLCERVSVACHGSVARFAMILRLLFGFLALLCSSQVFAYGVGAPTEKSDCGASPLTQQRYPTTSDFEGLIVPTGVKEQLDALQMSLPRSPDPTVEPVEMLIRQTVITISQPETKGCWASPVGNHDKQYLSVGFQQYNFGQNTLQDILFRYKNEVGTDVEIARIMPKYGQKLFSPGCMRYGKGYSVVLPGVSKFGTKITQACVDFLKSIYDNGPTGLKQDFVSEITELFNTPAMRQVQYDVFMIQLTRELKALTDYFGKDVTPIKVKWITDVYTQQGERGIGADDLKRVHASFDKRDANGKAEDLLAMFKWYEGSCLGSDSDGVGTNAVDCKANVPQWSAFVSTGLWKSNNETVELLLLTRALSRTADGYMQANCFERRARIALGCGMLNGTNHVCTFGKTGG